MRKEGVATLVILCCLTVARTAVAVDQPITGARLQLRALPSGKQKLVFKSKDPTFLFAVSGGSDDPRTEGLALELISQTAGTASMAAPATGGDPGWSWKPGQYKFKRGSAGSTLTPVKSTAFKQGRKIVVTADATGLALTAPLGRVGIRLTTGTLRNCALFAGAAVTVDTSGRFDAANAPAPPDCAVTTASGATCGNGVIEVGEDCDGSNAGGCVAGVHRGVHVRAGLR